jgi:predicted permease
LPQQANSCRIVLPVHAQVLAQMCFFVFVPTLTFAKITQAVSLDSIAHLWPLLLNLTLSVMLGLCLGLLLNRLLRTPIEFHTHALIACGFGNVGNFPLCEWQAAAEQVPGSRQGGSIAGIERT